jgi:hypothetical protein
MSTANTIGLHARNDNRNATLIKSLLCLTEVDEIINILNKNMSLADFDRAIVLLDAELNHRHKSCVRLKAKDNR